MPVAAIPAPGRGPCRDHGAAPRP